MSTLDSKHFGIKNNNQMLLMLDFTWQETTLCLCLSDYCQARYAYYITTFSLHSIRCRMANKNVVISNKQGHMDS